MGSTKRAILRLLILTSTMIYGTLTDTTPGLSMNVKVETHKTTFISVYPKLIDGTKLLTVQCETEGYYTDRFLPDIICKVAIQKLPIRPPEEPVRECEVSLAEDVLKKSERGSLAGFSLAKKFELEYVGNDKVIIKWSEKFFKKLYTKVMIVDMPHCTTNRLSYSEDVDTKYLHSNLVPRNDAFDVIIADQAVCSGKCRLSYDGYGKQIGLPKLFLTKFNDTHTTGIIDHNMTRGFYLLGFDDDKENITLTHVNSSGVEVQLLKISDSKYNYYPSSDAHGKYGLCYMVYDFDDVVQCLQYDAYGNVELNSRIDVGRNYTLLGVHNLAEDGLMLVSSSCQNKSGIPWRCKNFVITQVRDDEKWRTFSLASNEFSHDLRSVGASQSYVLENNTEVCVYLLNLYSHKIDNSDEVEFEFDINRVCFPKRLIERTSPNH